jgi:hypothetical protein
MFVVTSMVHQWLAVTVYGNEAGNGRTKTERTPTVEIVGNLSFRKKNVWSFLAGQSIGLSPFLIPYRITHQCDPY